MIYRSCFCLLFILFSVNLATARELRHPRKEPSIRTRAVARTTHRAAARRVSHKRHHTVHRRAPALPLRALPYTVKEALARAHIPSNAFSAFVERVGSQQPLLSFNARRLRAPASTMKLVTTFTGLSLLGPDYRWKTSVYTDGTVNSGVLRGNLYFIGTGDPKLIPEQLIDLVQKIRASGIQRIQGDLVLDKRFFDPATLDAPPLDDDPTAPYNVGPDPLLYAFQAITFTFVPQANTRQVAITMTPPLDKVVIVNHLTLTGDECASLPLAPTLIHNAQGVDEAVFQGNYSIRCGERTHSMAALNHTDFFAKGFLALWKQTGGSFTGQVRNGTTPLQARLVATHYGPVLSDIVHDTNKFSNNVMARSIYLAIGGVIAGPPATLDKSKQVVEQFLHRKGLAMPGLRLENGSGLSHTARITAAGLGQLLQVANNSPVAQAYIDSLPIIGVDGTMKHRLMHSKLVGRGRIKTGTLDNAKSIAGYLAAANNNVYIVVSFANYPHAGAAEPAEDALLEWVYEHAR